VNKLILSTIEAAFDQSIPETFLEFLEGGFKLNDEDRFTDYEIGITPWHRVVAFWVDDPQVEWINLVQGTQTGKTILEMAFGIYVSKKEPTRLLWVQSVEDEAKLFVTERLRPYIEGYDPNAINKATWKMEAFKVFHARWKIGFASTLSTLRSVPCKYVVGDECAIWKYPIAVVKKRTRTFEGKGRKGIFATSPPQRSDHHSWQEAISGDFYRWAVPCPHCNSYQPMIFKNLIWQGKNKDGAWNEEAVRKSAKYQCNDCGKFWTEDQKYEIINKGKLICVDPRKDFQECKPVGMSSKTLQVSALYSVLTKWGELAVEFLKAKRAGAETLAIFFSDELAETTDVENVGVSLHENELIEYVDPLREPGFENAEYNWITLGVDIQQKGDLYWVLLGFKSGSIPAWYCLDYGITRWKDSRLKTDWDPFLEAIGQYRQYIRRATIDSSDGKVTQEIYDFCNWYGEPFVALKDGGSKPIMKTQLKLQIPKDEQKKNVPRHQKIMLVNSAMIKDELFTAFTRIPGEEGAPSFHNDTQPDFLKSLTLEKRRVEREKSVYSLKYTGASNHYLSALVYALAGMEEVRRKLQITMTKQRRRDLQETISGLPQPVEPARQTNVLDNFEKGLDQYGI